MGELNDSTNQTHVFEDRCQERREWQRLLATGDYRVGLSVGAGHSQSATVKDASIAGIAVVVEDASKIVVDQSAEIEIENRRVRAQIKNIAPAIGGGYRVGLYWSEPDIGSILSLMSKTQVPCRDIDADRG